MHDLRTHSISKIARTIPSAAFNIDERRAWAYLVRDYALIIGAAVVIYGTSSWLVATIAALVMGTFYYALFLLGHDAGHRAFSKSKRTNDFAGHLSTVPVFMPFHHWRTIHDQHHRFTHHIGKDGAWEPLTVAQYRALPLIGRFMYKGSRSFFPGFGSMFFFFMLYKTTLDGSYPKVFVPGEPTQLRRSLLFATVYMLISTTTIIRLDGFRGLIFLVLIPQAMFHLLFSITTLIQHTTPPSRLQAADEWTPFAARFDHTFHLATTTLMGWIIDWVSHHVFWHIPHHVCAGIPHYHLPMAHKGMAKTYSPSMQGEPLSLRHLTRTLRRCHLINGTDASGLEWITFAEANGILGELGSLALKYDDV